MRRYLRSAAVVLLLGSSVYAARRVQTQPLGTQPMPDVDLTFRQQASLTPQEMLDQGQKDMNAMQTAFKRVTELQEQARKQNDIIKLNCVNDKVIQIKAAITIGEQSMIDLREAIARNDDGARIHAFTKVTIATQKVQILMQEAENCVGQDLSFVGETNVTTEIDPSIPQGDPTTPTMPNPVGTTNRPPEASPFI